MLYNHPINLFVASFIGSPSMNLIDGVLEAKDGNLVITGRDFTLRVPPERAHMIDQHVGAEVVLGIRPEHLFDREEVDAAPPDSTLSARVDLIEPLGSETLVHVLVGGQAMTARVSADSEIKRGQIVELVVDTRHLNVFDRKTQRALTR